MIVSEQCCLRDFRCRGSGLDAATNTRKTASAVFTCKTSLDSSKILQLSTKIRLYQASVMSVLLYAAETWTLLLCDEKTLEAFHGSANAKSCTYTGLSMSQTLKYPLVPAYHLLWT